MFTKEQDSDFEKVIGLLESDEDMLYFVSYCRKRIEGLRKEAFSDLDKFIDMFAARDFERRKRFVSVILDSADSSNSSSGAMCHNLNERIIKPTLDEWAKAENSNFLPFYWKAKYFYDDDALEYALRTFPNEQKPLILSLERDLNALYYSTHHMPEGYIGNVGEDMALIEKIEKRIVRVEDEKTRENLNADFQFYKELVLNYHGWKMSGEPDISEWAKKNGKRIDSGVRAFYYSK